VWARELRLGKLRAPLGIRQSLLVVGLILFLLFPVISITDDLQAAISFSESRTQGQDAAKQAIKSMVKVLPAQLLFLLILGLIAVLANFIRFRRRNGIALPIPTEFHFRNIENRPPPVRAFAL
jgi:hypothetical protein